MSLDRHAPGSRVGPYEVLRFLAEGGMGAVYEARDTRDDRRVALKVLVSAATQAVDRFEREARLTLALDHPNIVKLHAWSRDDDGAYMAMELLRGRSLAARLAEGPIAPTEVIRIAAEVCDALEYAHAHRVVHRDLTPANIFITDGPGAPVKVLDFGIARVVGEAAFTRTGTFLGTLRYVAPEQVTSAATVDARADLWTLGVVLFEGLTGHRPFDAEHHAAVLLKITAGGIPDAAALRPDLPRAVIDVLRATLVRDRDARIESAAELGRRLRAIDLSAPSVTARASDGSAERRTVSLVLALDLRDEDVARAVARDLGAEPTALPLHTGLFGQASTVLAADAASTGMLSIFGASRSVGDEPQRAARLARAQALLARTVVATTGRATASQAGVSGEAIDAAIALARQGGLVLDEVTRAADRDGVRRLASTADTVLDASAESPFVGRGDELEQLTRQVIAATESGVPSTTVVSSAPGHGKSRLLLEAAMRVRSSVENTTVVAVRCDPTREAVAYGALADALATAVGDDLVRPLRPGRDGDAQGLRDGARQCLLAVLSGLAERGPVLLAVDDAQWLDAASRSALRQVCDSGEYLPVALWFFCHPAAEDALTQVKSSAAEASRKSFSLAPLARGDAARLLAAVAPDAPETLLDRSGVVPLFVEEFARLWNTRGDASWESLPTSIDLVYQAQLDHLGAAAKDSLKRAAVFGRTFWLEGVRALGGDFEPRALGAVLTPRPRSRFGAAKEFAFRSALMQEVALKLWPDEERAALHGRAAAWLDAQGADAVEVAHHWELAHDDSKAAAMFTVATERAAGVSDASTTARLAERALALTTDEVLRWRALVARDRGLQLDGDRTLQREGLDAMEAMAPALGLEAMAQAAWRRCYFFRITGDPARAVEQGELACSLALGADTPRWQAAALNDLALVHADAGRLDEAIAHAEDAARLAQQLDDPWWRARTTATLAYAVNEGGDGARALALYSSAAQGFRTSGDARVESIALANGAFTLLRLGRVADALERFDDVLRRCHAVGNLRTTAMARANRGTLLRMLERYDEARAELDAADALATRIGHARVVSAARTERVYLALATGATGELRELAARCLDAGLRSGSAQLHDSARAAALRARVRAGDPSAEVAAETREAAARATAEGRLELVAALADADGWTPPHVAEIRSALDAAVAAIHADDPPGCEAALRKRFLVAA